MIVIEHILLLAAVLLIIGIFASKASYRLGVPALLLFLLMGILAGSEGPGGIPFDDPFVAQTVGVVALSFILFAGGIDTEWKSVSPIAFRGLALATVGVLLTALLVSWFAMAALNLSWIEGMLLGSIISSTDAAAVFAVLRSQKIGLKGRIKPLLELESGSNDPMAVFLTIGFIQVLQQGNASVANLFPMFFLSMGLGAGMGFLVGRGSVWFVNRLKLESEGLYPVVTVAVVLFAFGATATVGGNGFLAVYLAGIIMGNADFIHKRSLMRFHDGLAWLMQIAMFLVLGLLVFPSRLLPILGVGLASAVVLMFIARPVAVFLCLSFSDSSWREKTFVSWVGLRGAVPIILATFPLLAGVANAEFYFYVVFFVVLASVLLQGTTLPVVARLLRLDEPLPVRHHYPIEFVPATKTKSDLVEVSVPAGSPIAGKRIMDLGLPKSALIVLVNRGTEYVAPRGATIVQSEDNLLVLADKDDIPTLQEIVSPAEDSAEGAGRK